MKLGKSSVLLGVSISIGILALINVSSAVSGFCYDLETCCIGQPNGESFGDPLSCTVYIVCLLETSYLYECTNPEKPYYNVVKEACDGIENVTECSSGTRPPIETTTMTTTTEPTDPTTTTTTTTTPASVTTTEKVDGNCTEDGVYLIPYPGNCSLYMVCAWNVLLPDPQECPEGTLFDPEIGQCNLEHLVDCAPVCPPTGVSYHPDLKNCSRYWICALGIPSHFSCAPGLVFDSILGQCNSADLVFCPNLCPATGTRNLPHATNCTRYWLCVSGIPNLQSCAPGLAFDPELEQCNLENEVDCFSNSSICVSGSSNLPNLKIPDFHRDNYKNEEAERLFVKVRNPNNCNEIFICENDLILNVQKCPENTWFYPDETTGNGGGICREPKQGEVC